VALDAMFAPTSGLGFGYYITDGLSLRPWLGLGYSGYSGFWANLGAQLRYEVGAGWTVSPYVSASAQYAHTGSAAVVEPGGGGGQGTLVTQGDGGLFGAGVGARLRVTNDVSAFVEGRLQYATYPIGELRRGWSTFAVGDRSYGAVVLGISYLFH